MDNGLVVGKSAGDETQNVEDLAESLKVCECAVALAPDSALAHFNLGRICAQLGSTDTAEKSYRRALELRPDYAEAANNLGIIVAARREFPEAERLFRQAIAEQVDYFAAHFNLGNMLLEGMRVLEARYHLARALALKPDSVDAIDRLGRALGNIGRNEDAIALLKTALAKDEDAPSPWTNLAICYVDSGNLAAAEAAYRRALACRRRLLLAWHGLLFMSNYLARDRKDEFELHRAYGEAVAPKVAPAPHANLPVPGRRLRIGIVTADLRRHSVSYFVHGVLFFLDRRQFEPYAYFNYATPDRRTEEFRRLFYRWREIVGLSDEDVARQIRDDKIDILIDLSGHTSHNRLGVFALKPAPIQVSWIGYPNTTGLPQMDYRLTDSIADPEGMSDAYCVERLWRLPASFLCYSPPDYAPAVVEPPCLHRGHVTFGSFSTRPKLGAECIDLWARVLKAVPDSHLIVKSARGLEEAAARYALLDQFVARGIGRDRITVSPGKPFQEDHLAMYGEIDVALDTFPYAGVTTICEALWMGVPVVTRAGDRHVSRTGASVLTNAGLADLVAETDDQYVEIACQLAADPDALASVRRALRGVLKASRLLDERAMTADFSSALRSMWEIYCESRSVAADREMAADCEIGDAQEAAEARLLIGGTEFREGWQIFAETPGEGIDFDGDPCDLSRFGDETYHEVYCAHILQRLAQCEVVDYLRNLHRILRPAGRLYLSVPDLDVLAWLLASPLYSAADKFQMMRLLFGRQEDGQQFNQVGLNSSFLQNYLVEAGFSSFEHVESFGLFEDVSEFRVDSVRISLNLIVMK